MNWSFEKRFGPTTRIPLLFLFSFGFAACQETQPLNLDQIIQEANSLIQSRNYSEGLAKMRALVEANSEDPQIHLHYGEALIAAGQPSLAVWPLSRAIRSADHVVPAGLLLARAQSWAGSPVDAVKTATRVLEADPTNKMALLLRIESYLQENLEEKALEDIDRAEALIEDSSKLQLLRLEALLGLGREEDAERLLNELTLEAEETREQNPTKSARLCAATATFTFERGDIEGAKERFDACLEGDAVEHDILVRAAINFFDKNGEQSRATTLYQRRFEKDTDRLDRRVRYANRLQVTGRSAEGAALLLEATESQPAAWAALADLYAIDGDIESAVDALDHVIAADPRNSEDWIFSRSDFLLALGRTNEAEKALDVLEVPAHRALLKARLASERGEYDEAIQEFEEGIRLWPDNPDARYLAAQAYERKGQWKQAAAHYREAARMETPHYASSLALADLQRALGDIEGVNFLLARLAESRPNDPTIMERLIQFAWDTGAQRLGMRTLTRLSRLRGQAAHATVLMSERLEKTDGPGAALTMLEKSELDIFASKNIELLESRVRLLIGADRDEDAMQLIEGAISRKPSSAQTLVLRASVHRSQDELLAAEADLKEALKQDPEHLPALLELAELTQLSGDGQAARALYAQAIPLEDASAEPFQPGDARATIALVQLETAAGDVEAARERLRALIDANPRHGEAAWLLIRSYEDHSGGAQLSESERTDLALRASVFERSTATMSYWNELNASKS